MRQTMMRSAYGFAQINTELLPSRPDMSPEEREAKLKADRIEYRRLLREMRWTPEDFDRAQPFNFPRPLTFLYENGGRYGVYSREQIRNWALEIAAVAQSAKPAVK